MRRRRTIYFNDARHYYLYAFEPPITMEDAWCPVDECAGTAVDTFIYGVQSGGLFYPSKVGLRFGEEGQRPFESAIVWRVWGNMQSLMDRGLDPLTVLIDRAHDKGMEFFASMRLGGYLGIDSAHELKSGGRGWVHPEVRDHQFAVLEEMATEYPTEGVELDFTAPPGGSSYYFREEDAKEWTPVMTEWVKSVSEMVRNRSGGPGQVGARVYPTEAINLAAGLDVQEWLGQRLVDFVVPMIYGHFSVDCDMPIDWLIESAHEADVSVYPMLEPYYVDDPTEYATPAMMRAAAANYWARGADGMYTWFLQWPLGDKERGILTELGDPEAVKEGNKHYSVTRSSNYSQQVRYETPLPLQIPATGAGTRHGIPLYVADDIDGAVDRVRQVRLRLNIGNLVSSDRLTVVLNGRSLSIETCLREYAGRHVPYEGQWLEFHLKDVRPRKGRNLLEISFDGRPVGLAGGVTIENVELIVEYGSYPSRLSASSEAST